MTFNISNGESGASVRNKLNTKFNTVLDVKDFGAVGDNSTDDRIAIQAAFDAAHGTWASPNGTTNSILNKPVYFPVGIYKVSSPATTTITDVVTHTVGGEEWCLCTVASTTGFATGDMAYVRGVVGVGNANGSYGIDVLSAGSPGTILLRNSRFSGTYDSGGTITQPCLRIRQAGIQLYGEGSIKTTSPNCAVLTLNGVQGTIRDLAFDGGDIAGTIGLDYNWCQRVDDEISSQSVGFYNLFCAGADYGLAIGMGQAMCSETTISKCFFSGRTGVYIGNQNAISQNILGGNISGCKDYGIHVNQGSATVIQGIGFQSYFNAVLAGFGYIVGNVLHITAMTTVRHPGIGFEVDDPIFSETPGITDGTTITGILTGTGGIGTYSLSNSMTFASSGSPVVIGTPGKADIYTPNGTLSDAAVISGCRSESQNFAWLPYNQPFHIDSCGHIGGGFFYHGAGNTKITACQSSGWINPSSGILEVDATSKFSTTDYWRHTEGADPNNPAFVSITPQPIIVDSSTARSTMGMDNNCLIQFSSSSSTTYTLTKTDASSTRMIPGSWIDIQRTGTGSLTIAGASGVTVHAPTTQGSITARARYSKVRVMVDAENVYTVSGDITP